MLKVYINGIIKDLEKQEQIRLIAAAKHLKEKVKENVKSTWKKHTGNLLKGIGYKNISQHTVLVGYGPPASHAHLLELGTAERTVKNYMGVKGAEKKVGKIKAQPVLFPTFDQESGEVEKILNRVWL